MDFFAIAENETRGRMKFNLLKKMLQPVGKPPERTDLDLDCRLLHMIPVLDKISKSV